MEAKAHLRYARIAPRKVQIVLDLIRGKDADMAMAILKHTPKAACEQLEKLLKSAIANAENNHAMDKDNLYVCINTSDMRVPDLIRDRAVCIKGDIGEVLDRI